MAAAYTSTAVREGHEIARWDYYLEDDGDLRLVKKKNPKQESSAQAKLDPDLWSRLNDSLTAQIIAKLQFKALFRAASLSKTWSLALRSPSFQRKVACSSSPSWASYSPLFINEKQQLLGYDGKSQLWHRLPTRWDRSKASGRSWCLETSGGSLLCWTSGYRLGQGYYIHVSNPLNGSWKQLPSPPEKETLAQSYGPIFHVVCQRNDAYQVIVVSFHSNYEYERDNGRFIDGSICIRIFDSSSESWTITSHDNDGPEVRYGGSVLLNGVIYVLLARGCETGNNLVAFHVRDRTWNMVAFVQDNVEHQYAHSRLIRQRVLELQLHGMQLHGMQLHGMQLLGVYFSQLVVCGSDMMLVVHYWVGAGDAESIALFKVDSEQGLALILDTVPREMLIIGRFHCVVGYGDCLCIFGQYPSSLTITYNVKTRDWNWASVDILSPAEADIRTVGDEPRRLRCRSRFGAVLLNSMSWIHSKYEPGWNPFLKV